MVTRLSASENSQTFPNFSDPCEPCIHHMVIPIPCTLEFYICINRYGSFSMGYWFLPMFLLSDLIWQLTHVVDIHPHFEPCRPQSGSHLEHRLLLFPVVTNHDVRQARRVLFWLHHPSLRCCSDHPQCSSGRPTYTLLRAVICQGLQN